MGAPPEPPRAPAGAGVEAPAASTWTGGHGPSQPGALLPWGRWLIEVGRGGSRGTPSPQSVRPGLCPWVVPALGDFQGAGAPTSFPGCWSWGW